jgi:LacI family transcriptional regulator
MDLMFTRIRLDGIREGLTAHGLAWEDPLLRIGNLTQQGGYEKVKSLLDLKKPPTAIIACNDLTAFGAMGAIQEKGLVVGKDISVTGFDDIPMAAYSHPPLTTVHQPVYKIGRMICEMLAGVVQGVELEEEQILLRPKLIIRESSGKIRSNQ